MSESEKQPMKRFDPVPGGVEDCNVKMEYPWVERRKDWHSPGSCVNMQIVERRFSEGSERMDRIEKALEINTEATTEIRDILQLGKSFFRIADLIGRLVKWVAAIAVPIIGIWVTLKGGERLP